MPNNWIIVEDKLKRAMLFLSSIPQGDEILLVLVVAEEFQKQQAELVQGEGLYAKHPKLRVVYLTSPQGFAQIELLADAIMLLDMDLPPVAPYARSDRREIVRKWVAQFVATACSKNLVYVTSAGEKESVHCRNIREAVSALPGGHLILDLDLRVTGSPDILVDPHDTNPANPPNNAKRVITDAKEKWIGLHSTDTACLLKELDAIPAEQIHQTIDHEWSTGAGPQYRLIKTLRDVLRTPDFEKCFCGEGVMDSSKICLRESIRKSLKSIAGHDNGVSAGGIWLLAICSFRDTFPDRAGWENLFAIDSLDKQEVLTGSNSLAIIGLAATPNNLPKTLLALCALFKACFKHKNAQLSDRCNLVKVSVAESGVCFSLKGIHCAEFSNGLDEAYGDLCDRALAISEKSSKKIPHRHGLSSLLLVTMLGGRIGGLEDGSCAPGSFCCDIGSDGAEVKIAFGSRS